MTAHPVLSAHPVLLGGAAYVLGETEVHHSRLEGLAERARELSMAPKAELWGWGNVRRTDRPLEDLAAEAGRAALAAAAVAPQDVDGLVLCSTRFPGGPRTHGGFTDAVLTGIGLTAATCTGVTLNRCTTLLVGIRLAQALVVSGQHRRVLVVTTDRVTDESTRMESYALFSDGAAACLITSAADGRTGGAYEIVTGAHVQRPGTLDWSHEISPDLAREVNDRMLTPLGMKTGDLDLLVHPNLYTPVVVLKERQAGFAQQQLFTDNITRIGHCFAADPLINLVDLDTAGRLRAGGHCLLASSVPGARAAVLLRKPDDDERQP
ncbi:3-oxoacyl-[acyl-carrier-protein] synthase-3 [Streptomyces sp. yr375]|uniref:3-oxoacyl-ACP synthase n=1 Tax=Streptomyces sp. yr375 TaxID=1761906 RepID=UPI0008BC54F2|nr:3-oxoacyl-ACP synthase [Streptomyces sp. yr375]SES05021.1 3-oxoacyl-[acyl-carrier-protein] synthase-3 [Streptomyces sp. yr375]